jgi:hypothetical protein
MIDVADILQRLQALAAEDRTWILGRLPAAAKATLLAAASGESSLPPPAAAREIEGPVLPTTLAPQSVAAALKEEPAWIAASILGNAAGPWIAEVLAHLPPGLRSDIASLRRSDSVLTPLARETLVNLLLAQIGQSEPPPPTPSKFHTLLERLSASRSRKRMTLHL